LLILLPLGSRSQENLFKLGKANDLVKHRRNNILKRWNIPARETQKKEKKKVTSLSIPLSLKGLI